MEEAESICDRIIILDNGKIIASGTTDELKKLSNIEEKITVELNSISNNDIDKLSKFKQIRNISYKDNLLIITYSKAFGLVFCDYFLMICDRVLTKI